MESELINHFIPISDFVFFVKISLKCIFGHERITFFFNFNFIKKYSIRQESNKESIFDFEFNSIMMISIVFIYHIDKIIVVFNEF